MTQIDAFGPRQTDRRYRPVLTAHTNPKGVLDVDTVKGCTAGTAKHPKGCYGDCYAAKMARVYGMDFSTSVSRRPVPGFLSGVLRVVAAHHLRWYRTGVAGDPSHDWANTVNVCELLRCTRKTPVVVTKHWRIAQDDDLRRLADVGTVFNTSTSGMDTDAEIKHRVGQLTRIAAFGMRSVCRVVTCRFGGSEWARRCREAQKYLLSFPLVIDTPFRTTSKHPHVANGDILLSKRSDSVGGGSRSVSLWSDTPYLGTCADCPDQCGVAN